MIRESEAARPLVIHLESVLDRTRRSGRTFALGASYRRLGPDGRPEPAPNIRHETYRVYAERPGPAALRKDVKAVLEGKLKPVATPMPRPFVTRGQVRIRVIE